jgi:hypothetical protein
MNSIEQGLLKLDQHNQDAIEKHIQLLAKSVYEGANQSQRCSHNQTRELKQIFPELEDLGKDEGVFNPKFIMEFHEGKPSKFRREGSWDTSHGLLPERKVMGEYFIDVGEQLDIISNTHYCHTHKKCSLMRHYGSIKDDMSNNTLECGCKFRTKYSDIYKPIPDSIVPDIQRGVDRASFMTVSSYNWEIDNYLNLYHRNTGLYLMFHKTVFPMLGFFINSQFSKYLYRSKRLEKEEETIDFTKFLNTPFLSALDNESYLLEKLDQVIPDNYSEIFDTFDRFRRMQSFQTNIDQSFQEKAQLETDSKLDVSDNIILSYKTRLAETLIRAEKSEEYQQEMIEKYNEQSGKLQTLQLELDHKILQHQEEFFTKTQQILETHLIQERVKLEELEKEKQSNMTLLRKLSEKEISEGRLTVVNQSLEVIKKENHTLELKMNKIRGINASMIANFQEQKEQNKKLIADNQSFHENFLNVEVERNSLQQQVSELQTALLEEKEEIKRMTQQLQEKGENSSNCLENALSDKLEQLEAAKQKVEEELGENRKQNESLKAKLTKYQRTLSSLTSQLE